MASEFLEPLKISQNALAKALGLPQNRLRGIINGKRGRGTEKTAVVIGLSLGEEGHPGYVRAQVIDHVDGETLGTFAEETIEKGSEIRSDGYPSYQPLSGKGYRKSILPH